MEEWGNGRANDYYEANVPSHVIRPKEGDSVRVVEKFIREKYEFKRYLASSIPPKRDSSSNDQEAEEVSTRRASVRQRPANGEESHKVLTAPANGHVHQAAAKPVAAVVKDEPSLLDFLDEPTTTSSAASIPSQQGYSDFMSAPNQPTDMFNSFMPSTAPPPPAPAPAVPQMPDQVG
jgi:hypothetical protein